ncbi:3-isopropylmalate dehydratase large subunit [Streptomyces platensis]|uniref:3-isopropylmalate dehydratase large subunit n=1 Tax=Streptomyces platensis TaxID=58346 RepID=UPI0036AFBC17
MIPQTMTHKILARAAGRDHVVAGEIVEVGIDMAFTHDPVCEGLRREFRDAFGPDATVWDPERIALFEDHLVPAKDAESRRLAAGMTQFATEQGISHHYPYGENYGICHVMMCDEGLVQPGTVVLGTDSHSVTYGAFNAFGSGVGMIDMVNAFYTGDLWFRVPETIEVRIEGELPPGVLAKDVILTLIGDLGMGGASGRSIEFTGSTIDTMSVEERMTLCNMVVEAGAVNGIMALSPAAADYLAARPRTVAYEPVTSDPGAPVARRLAYRAEKLRPAVAYPHRPDNVHSIDEAMADRIRVDQVYIGSCTGAKYDDIEVAAAELAGKRVAPGVRLMIVPATMGIYRRLALSGTMATLLAAGAVVESPGCKACYGAHGGVVGDGEVCLSTTNRNFRGRMGNPKSSVYLASPIVAARSALAGRITE